MPPINPESLIESLGLTLIETRDLDPRFNAVYLHHRRAIVIQKDLDPYTRRCCLAHEIGHAVYGDTEHGNPRLERRADLFAANLLINIDEYAAAETLHEGNAGAIAHELGVTPNLLKLWKTDVERKRIAS